MTQWVICLPQTGYANTLCTGHWTVTKYGIEGALFMVVTLHMVTPLSFHRHSSSCGDHLHVYVHTVLFAI